MAAAQDQSALAIANTLTEAEIPVKLRCAVCNKLAVNAFKLPCCDQSICENCQTSLPSTCPVCAHSPLDASTSKPNKSLRLTVKAFIKAEERKRNKDSVDTKTPAPAVSAVPGPSDISTDTAVEANPSEAGATPVANDTINVAQDTQLQTNDVVDSIEQPEEPNNPDQTLQTMDEVTDMSFNGMSAGAEDSRPGGERADEIDNDEVDEGGHANNGSENDNHGTDHQQSDQNTDWNNNGGFNPMMQMQNNAFGGFPGMMGMPNMGMGMNPMQMPNNMFGGFGGMGMNDMSAMNMNMGMGFGGGFGGWNGSGMGNNFDAGYHPNGGYNQQQMHQGSYGSNMHDQQFSNRNFRGRYRGQGFQRGYGRGRGGYDRGGYDRGGYDRGGYGRGGQFQQQNYRHMQNSMSGTSQMDDSGYSGQVPSDMQSRRPSQGSVAASTRPDSQYGQPTDTAHAGEQVAPNVNDDVGIDDAADVQEPKDTTVSGTWEQTVSELPNGDDPILAESTAGHNQNHSYDTDDAGQEAERNFSTELYANQVSNEEHQNGGEEYHSEPRAGSYESTNQQVYGYAGRGRGGFGRGGFGGRGGYGAAQQVSAPAPPVNAPTGPKAMREGLPNSGRYSRPTFANTARTPQPSQVEVIDDVHSRPVPEQAERARSRSRSSSRHRKRKHRDRSYSTSSQDREAKERRRERRRRHEKRYEDDYRDDYAEEESMNKKPRSGSSSPRDDRSHRDRRREKERHRSSRDEKDSDRDRRRHRHRSRSPRDDESRKAESTYANQDESSHHKGRSYREREKERDYETSQNHDRRHGRDKERTKEKNIRHRSRSPDEYDFSKRYESSRRSRQEREVKQRPHDVEHKEREIMQAPADDIGFKIKGSRSAALQPSASTATSVFTPPTGPKKDRAREGNRRPSHQSQDGSNAASAIATTTDPYAQEREARHRERMLKEQQRRESATMGKRSRPSMDDGAPVGPKSERERDDRRKSGKGRRVSYKYEDDEGDEDRTYRVEREREMGRWE